MRSVSILLALCFVSTAQVSEYDFYAEFRRWGADMRRTEKLAPEAIVERYRSKLASEGVASAEINRRVRLLTTDREKLEVDFWNRYLTDDKPVFNTEPNAFLLEILKDRKPGNALDMGMGQGRNAIYLAKQGWKVTGIDPADRAVELARKRAGELGLTLETHVIPDTKYDFGKEKWDLVLYSWTAPSEGMHPRVIESLKRGGIVVHEGGGEWFARNAWLKQFDSLRILRYEYVVAKSDYFGRREIPTVRFVAQKE